MNNTVLEEWEDIYTMVEIECDIQKYEDVSLLIRRDAQKNRRRLKRQRKATWDKPLEND